MFGFTTYNFRDFRLDCLWVLPQKLQILTIVFKSAGRTKVGVTTLEYKGLQLGKVTKIGIHEDLKKCKSKCLVDKG